MDRTSYENVKHVWHKEIAKECPNVPTILVGTKVDLRHSAMASDIKEDGKSMNYVTYQQVSRHNCL